MKNVLRGIALFLMLGLSVTMCSAQTYHVSMNTDALYGSGTYYVEWQLTDGSISGDGNSMVGITNFSLTGGVLGAVLPPTIGDISGSLATTLTLKDSSLASSGVADYAQGFTTTQPHSVIDFDLALTASSLDNPTPDKFSFVLLDGVGASIATDGPTGGEFVSADFLSNSPIPQGYSSVTGLSLKAVVTQNGSGANVPEPGNPTFLLAIIACGGFVINAKFRRRNNYRAQR